MIQALDERAISHFLKGAEMLGVPLVGILQKTLVDKVVLILVAYSWGR